MSADLLALIQPLQPFAQALVNLAGRAGVQPRVTSTLRSRSQQQRLYSAFLRGESKYPVAPPGTSAHEFGFAFDMIADSAENLHDLGTVWVQWGGVWHPSDEVHFEFPGFSPPDLPVDSPLQEIGKTVTKAIEDVPWYVQLFTPFYTTTASKSFTEAAKGSPGSRFFCAHGFSSFC